MSRSNFLADLLFSIFERREGRASREDKRSIETLCEALLSEQGEASGTRIAGAVLDRYGGMDEDAKRRFFALLVDEYDIDPKKVADRAAAYGLSGDSADLAALMHEAEPPRQELLRRLNRWPGATGQLVRMRADLLDMLDDTPSFRRVDLDFEHLFASWFNRGFLVLRRIDWTAPANILEKIIAYESVHAIGDWDDLRRRLAPPDRRCFAFFHPAMPDEPLIFVEVALTNEMPDSIQAVLSDERDYIAEEEASTAVFYSISNCQKGLAGVSFGNFLIKQVAIELSQSLPDLTTFVTLSPAPGLNAWLKAQADAGTHADAAAIAEILAAQAADELAGKASMLTRLAAEYLCTAKRVDGRPADPVARFHLGNGARLERINAGADSSAKGLATSSGVMVNYLYDLSSVEANHEAYAQHCEVVAAKPVLALVSDKKANLRRRENA